MNIRSRFAAPYFVFTIQRLTRPVAALCKWERHTLPQHVQPTVALAQHFSALEIWPNCGAKVMELNTLHSSFLQRKAHCFVNSFTCFSSFYLPLPCSGRQRKGPTGYKARRLRHTVYILHGKVKFILKDCGAIVKPQK